MLKTKIKRRAVEVVTGFVCDHCGAEWSDGHLFEMQERISISFVGGYGSVWGDMNRVEVDLCQDCGLEMFAGIARVSGT